MVVSLMTLLWAGISYLGSAYSSSLAAKSAARGCAWQVSASSCEEIPEGCEVSIGRGKERSDDDALESAADSATGSGLIAKIARATLLDQITSLFSKRARASSSEELKEPHRLGGKEVLVGQHFSLPCNTQGKSEGAISEMIEKAVNTSTGKSK